MKSIKNQYIALKEGKMTEAQFMRNVRMSLPQYVSNTTLFKQAEKILINKGIISEINLGNNQWLSTFEDALGFKTYMSPNWIIDNYGHLNPKEAADKFIEDTTATQIAHDDETFRRETSESLNEINIDGLKQMGYSDSDIEDLLDEWGQGGSKLPEKVKDYLDGLYNTRLGQIKTEPLREAKDTSATGYFNQDGKEQYGKFEEIDNMNGQEVMAGYVIEKSENPDKDKVEICKLIIKNLKSDPYYYTNYKLTGVRGQKPVEFTSTKRKPGFDQAEEVSKKADNLVDTKNATQVVKENLEATIGNPSFNGKTKKVKVGDKAKLQGKEVTITKIDYTKPGSGATTNKIIAKTEDGEQVSAKAAMFEPLDEATKAKLKEAIRKVMKEMFDGRDNLTDVNEIDEIPKALKNLEVGDVFRVVGDVDWSVMENTNYKITFLGDYLLDFKTVKNPEHAALGQTGTMNLNRFKENVLSGNIIIYPK